jgi:hypothetical protein
VTADVGTSGAGRLDRDELAFAPEGTAARNRAVRRETQRYDAWAAL